MEMARPLSRRARAGEEEQVQGLVPGGPDPGGADPGGAAAAALAAAAGRVAALEEGAKRSQAELGRLQAQLDEAQARAHVMQRKGSLGNCDGCQKSVAEAGLKGVRCLTAKTCLALRAPLYSW